MKYYLAFFVSCFLTLMSVTQVFADSRCGWGYLCWPSASYLRVFTCDDETWDYCANLRIQDDYTVDCTNPSNCSTAAPGRYGCLGTEVWVDECECTYTYATCSVGGSSCGTVLRCSEDTNRDCPTAGVGCASGGEPYGAGTCTPYNSECVCTSDLTCSVQDGTIGCCIGTCNSSCVGKCNELNGCQDMCTSCGTGYCGDGVCSSSESCSSCISDCNTCGDGCCSATENCSSCSTDCGACFCGDGNCTGGEDMCCVDCSGVNHCGNGSCDCGENSGSCPGDCPANFCGDGNCAGGENKCNCETDCGNHCGDGVCNCSETYATCSSDCAPPSTCPGNGCQPGEDRCNCPADCGSPIGDGECNCGETNCTAPLECPPAPSCGDGVCECDEDTWTCPQDCDTCGDGNCFDISEGGTETCETCPSDCPSCCPDTICQDYAPYDEQCTCAADCPGSFQVCGNGSCECNEATTCPGDCGLGVCGNGVCEPADGETCAFCPLDCTCPADCPCPEEMSWWQVTGAGAYAQGTDGYVMMSEIPSDEDGCGPPDCIPYLVKAHDSDDPNTAGIPMTGGGGLGVNDDFSIRDDNPHAIDTTMSVQENYTYFASQYGMGASSTSFPGSTSDATKPPSLDLDADTNPDKPYLVAGDLTIQQQWSVASGETIVVFVENNLTISDPSSLGTVIEVEEGGFLAFIVGGNIIIEDTVGNAIVPTDPSLDDVTPNVEGIYIADGQITIESQGDGTRDLRFIGAGTFVGWNGFVLPRNFDDGTPSGTDENKLRPTELFMYRPDMVQHTPQSFKRPHYVWQETN